MAFAKTSRKSPGFAGVVVEVLTVPVMLFDPRSVWLEEVSAGHDGRLAIAGALRIFVLCPIAIRPLLRGAIVRPSALPKETYWRVTCMRLRMLTASNGSCC